MFTLEMAIKTMCARVCVCVTIAAIVSGQEKDQAKQIFTSSAASGILTNDLVKILQDEKVSIVAETELLVLHSCVLIPHNLALA